MYVAIGEEPRLLHAVVFVGVEVVVNSFEAELEARALLGILINEISDHEDRALRLEVVRRAFVDLLSHFNPL